jgi:sec-independent protein translocase protein TatB
MFGLGLGEMLLIGAIALLVVGPDKLPHMMREMGRYYGQLRRAADDLRRAFVLEADRQDASDRYRQLQERRRVAQEVRKKAQELAGQAVAQPEIEPAPPTSGPPAPEGEGPSAPNPNDLAPDSPHPSLLIPRVPAASLNRDPDVQEPASEQPDLRTGEQR